MSAAAAAEMIEMTEMIEALNQRLVVMEVESLRRNDQRALEVAAMTAAQAAATAAVEQSKVSEIAAVNLITELEERVNLSKAQHDVLDIKISRYDTRLTALIDNVKDNAGEIIEDILEEKEQQQQKTGEKKEWKKEIMESKAIGQIDRLADGKKYRQRLSKFKNLFDQAKRGGRVVLGDIDRVESDRPIAKAGLGCPHPRGNC